MGPRGVFRHGVCGRAQRIVRGCAIMCATRVPSRFKSRRADTPLVGPAGCQQMVKLGAALAVLRPRVFRVSDCTGIFGGVTSPTLCWRAESLWRHHRTAYQRKFCEMLRNVHCQNMFARIPMDWMWAVGPQFDILVWAQASILMFLCLLGIPLRDTTFLGIQRGACRKGPLPLLSACRDCADWVPSGGRHPIGKISQSE